MEIVQSVMIPEATSDCKSAVVQGDTMGEQSPKSLAEREERLGYLLENNSASGLISLFLSAAIQL